MSTAGAVLRAMDPSTTKGTIMNQLADTIRTIFERYLDESVYFRIPLSKRAYKRSCQRQPLSPVATPYQPMAPVRLLYVYEMDEYSPCYAHHSPMHLL